MQLSEAVRLGLCTACRCKPTRTGLKTCAACAGTKAAWYRKKRKQQAVVQRKWKKANPAKVKSYQKAYQEKIKRQVFDHYGWACACCGEDEPKFLSIDHINGGGTKHRNGLGTGKSNRGSGFYRWLVKSGFPKEFQTLCFNCNCAKGFYGSCPHEKKSHLKAVR